MGSNGELVLNHALLEFVLDFSRESQCGWLRFERRHVNRRALICLLPRLACVSRVTRLCAGSAPQYAALRLAALDVKIAGVECSSSRKAKYTLQAYDKNVELFSKSWEVNIEVPEHLRTSPLDVLSVEELYELRLILQSGWQ